MIENLLTVDENDRDGIAIIDVPGADRPKAQCPHCGRTVAAFELAQLTEEQAALRGVNFACGHCLTQWEREGI